MFCKVCGAKMADGTLFCPSCGRPMNMPTDKGVREQRGSAQQTGAQQVSAQQAVTHQVSAQQAGAQQVSAQQVSTQQVSARQVSTQQVHVQQSSSRDGQMHPLQGVQAPAVPAPVPVFEPVPVKQKKSGTFKFVLAGMISLLFIAVLAVGVFGFTQGWFTDDREDPSENSTPSDTAPSQQPTVPTQEPTLRPSEGEEQELVPHQWEGVTFYLPEKVDAYHWDSSYVEYYCDQLMIRLDSYKPATMSDTIVSSRTFAEYYKSRLADNYRQVGIYNQGEVYYTQGIYNDSNLYEVTGFYMAGDYAYTVAVTDESTARMEEIIEIVTTVVIDSTVIPPISNAENVKTDTPSYQGLTLHLRQKLEADGYYQGGVGFESGSMRLMIEQGSLSDAWVDFTDSASMAQSVLQAQEGLWQEVSVGTFNGRSYVQCRDDDGYSCVIGCYVRGGQWWEVSLYFYDVEMYTADAIRDVTSGTFDS